MRFLLAVIQPTKLKAVKNALARIGVERMTVCDSQVYADNAEIPILRGTDNRAHVQRRVVLEIAVNEDFIEPTIETILNVAKTGRLGNDGDGKIFVLPLTSVLEIAQGTEGPGAI